MRLYQCAVCGYKAESPASRPIKKCPRFSHHGAILAQRKDEADRAANGPPEASSADDIRAAGWVVASHHDFKVDGRPHTIWLFLKSTPNSSEERCVSGRGPTDKIALNTARAKMGLPMIGT